MSARPRGDTQLMWFRSRLTSSVPTMLTTRSDPSALAYRTVAPKNTLSAPLARSWRLWINDFRGFDSPRQKVNSPINLPQPSLAVLIIGVFTAIAIARSPRHHLHDRGTILGEQKMPLVFQSLQAAWSDVVGALISRRLRRFRSSREPLSHPAGLPPASSILSVGVSSNHNSYRLNAGTGRAVQSRTSLYWGVLTRLSPETSISIKESPYRQ